MGRNVAKQREYTRQYYKINRKQVLAYQKARYAARKLYGKLSHTKLVTIRPLQFWGVPALYLFVADRTWIGKGHNKLTAVKDALFNIRRASANNTGYKLRRDWLLNMIEKGDIQWKTNEE